MIGGFFSEAVGLFKARGICPICKGPVLVRNATCLNCGHKLSKEEITYSLEKGNSTFAISAFLGCLVFSALFLCFLIFY